MTTHRLFASPPRYIQGPGVLALLAEVLHPFGRVPLVVTDSYVLALVGEFVERDLRGASLQPRMLVLPGDITYAAVEELLAQVGAVVPGVVVGLGGGKALDAGKAVARRLGLPVVTVPTVASNDSPTSAAIAMYDESHALVAVDRLSSNPACVLVDTELIAGAPSEFLRAGIGDAVSKLYEAQGCAAGSGLTPWGTRPLRTALGIARECESTLRAHSAGALAACDRSEVDDSLEAVVEAVMLMSGLAFENGGLSLAHSLTRGLMRVDGARDLPHGYHVAWGALVQLAAEGRDDAEILDLQSFLAGISLPVCSLDLGLGRSPHDGLREIAQHTMTAPHLANLALTVTEDDVVRAAEHVDELAASA
jgi:glycerol dehydrogenase